MRLFMQERACPFARVVPIAALAAMLASAGALRAQDTTHAAPDSARAAADTAHAAPVTNPTSPAPTSPAAPDATATTATGQTHTVKKGDTLWDISRQYLNDPFLWPEIYRLNTEVVEDPHWIYPGEVLRIPGGAQLVAEDSMAPALQPLPEVVPARSGGPTVFAQATAHRILNSSRFGASAAAYPHAAVRPGEFYAAPWVDRSGGPAGQGRVIQSADLPGIEQASMRDRFFPQDRIYITLPKGVVAARGDRLMTVAEGPVLPSGRQVLLPTAIVEVERADNGDATTVRIVRQFRAVEPGQGVLPLDRFPLKAEARPTPLMLGTESTVIYVSDHAVLPSTQSYVILDATAKDGIKVGDQFTLFRPRMRTTVPGTTSNVVLPEEKIALAQVVKVTNDGVTAMIVDQRQPAIAEGVHARLTARMP